MKKLTHTNRNGKLRMVSVTEKKKSHRTARAYGEVFLSIKAFELLRENKIQKGDVLTAAKIAGIQAAKKTSELIPLCHNIFISNIELDLVLNPKSTSVRINSYAETTAETGIEMEALTAVGIAALTVYDMCKAVDKNMTISNISLLSKTGGKSGDFINEKNGK